MNELAVPRLARWAVPALVLLIAGLALFAWSRQASLTERGPQVSPATTTAPVPGTTTTLPTALPTTVPTTTPSTRPVTTTSTIPPTSTTTVPTTTPATIPVTTTSTIPPTSTTTVARSPVERPAECLSCPPPSYPPAARSFGLEGEVVVEIVVDEKGRVTEARVLSGHSAFRDAARKAVLAWRYAPATRDGVPVACTRRVPVQFTLAPKTPP